MGEAGGSSSCWLAPCPRCCLAHQPLPWGRNVSSASSLRTTPHFQERPTGERPRSGRMVLALCLPFPKSWAASLVEGRDPALRLSVRHVNLNGGFSGSRGRGLSDSWEQEGIAAAFTLWFQ